LSALVFIKRLLHCVVTPRLCCGLKARKATRRVGDCRCASYNTCDPHCVAGVRERSPGH
jgi:hypothetical protein